MARKKKIKCPDGLEGICEAIGEFKNPEEFLELISRKGEMSKAKREAKATIKEILQEWPRLLPEEGDLLIRHVLRATNTRYVLERRMMPNGDETITINLVRGDNPMGWRAINYASLVKDEPPGGAHLLYLEDDLVV